ncbi:MAG: hypothetical protein HYR72_22895 [Deltaproteobacteria bacterium]|nr:hypothetical protein [Deltaproteobacteria bacterium]MBI3390696.1 hypothetical protein [Deltaproteobacteria bacterium]
MAEERTATERIVAVLRPFASNWSGTLGRGDLVIPQREIPRLIHDILSAVQDSEASRGEAGDAEVFHIVSEGQRLPSMQDLVGRLREAFLILRR